MPNARKAAFALIGMAAGGLLFLGPWAPSNPSTVTRSLGWLVHAAFWFMVGRSVRGAGRARYLIPLAVAAVEGLQALIGREPSLVDALYGLGGWGMALLVDPAGGVAGRGRRMTAAALALLLLVGPSVYVWSAAAVYRRFPVLMESPSRIDALSWSERGMKTQRTPAAEGSMLSLQSTAGVAFPGATLSGFPKDWSGYRRLVVEVAADEQAPAALGVRLDDGLTTRAYGDRLEHQWPLRPGEQTLVMDLPPGAPLPSGRLWNASNVTALTLFFPDERLIRRLNIRLIDLQ